MHTFTASLLCARLVYVYNLSGTPLWDVDDLSTDEVFGETQGLNGHLRATRQWSASLIVLKRLSESRCRTMDPASAHAFFVPLFPRPKSFQRMNDCCSSVTESSLLERLPYLTGNNARRHFTVLSKSFRSCGTGEWFSNPKSALMRQFLKFAYDEPLPFRPFPRKSKEPYLVDYVRDRHGEVRFENSTNGGLPFPNVRSFPYPSGIHWSSGEEDPTRSLSSKKKTLMLFMGHFTKGARLREVIKRQCRSYRNDSTCTIVNEGVKCGLEIKASATFCLEPAGDTPSRKSISDSLAFGCIPVVFANSTASLYRGFWDPGARFVIDYDDFVDGKLDLATTLSSVAPRDLEGMRAAVERTKKRFTYSLNDDSGDALDVLLSLVDDYSSNFS